MQIRGPGFNQCLFCYAEDNLECGPKFLVDGINICCNSHDYDQMMKFCKLCLRCIGRLQQVIEFSEVLNEKKTRVKFHDSCTFCYRGFDKEQILSKKFDDVIRKVISGTFLNKTYNPDQVLRCCFACYGNLEMLNIIITKMKILKEKFMENLESWFIPLSRVDEISSHQIKMKIESFTPTQVTSNKIEECSTNPNVMNLSPNSLTDQQKIPTIFNDRSEIFPKIANKKIQKKSNTSFRTKKYRSQSVDSRNHKTIRNNISLTAASSRPKRFSTSSNSTRQSVEISTTLNLSSPTTEENINEEHDSMDYTQFNLRDCSVALNKLNIQIDIADEQNEENIVTNDSTDQLSNDTARNEHPLTEIPDSNLNLIKTEKIYHQSPKTFQQDEDKSGSLIEIEFLNNNRVVRFYSGAIAEEKAVDTFDVNSIEMNYTIEGIDSIEALEEIITTPTIQNTETIKPFDEFLKEDSLLVVN